MWWLENISSFMPDLILLFVSNRSRFDRSSEFVKEAYSFDGKRTLLWEFFLLWNQICAKFLLWIIFIIVLLIFCWKAHALCDYAIGLLAENLLKDGSSTLTWSLRPKFPHSLRPKPEVWLDYVTIFVTNIVNLLESLCERFWEIFLANGFFSLELDNRIYR